MNKSLLLKLIRTSKINSGFTLIELLVVIIIVGILSAIALPSFLNQTGKARQSEARSNLGAIVRGQQAYYTENGKFAETLQELGIGISEDTSNYTYSSEIVGEGKGAIAIAVPQGNATYKGYLGAAALVNAETNPTIATAICESKSAGSGAKLSAEDLEIRDTEIACINGSAIAR